jgi:hypothetical protein
MKLPRRNFLHLAAGAVALPVVSRFCEAGSVGRLRIVGAQRRWWRVSGLGQSSCKDTERPAAA